MTPSFRPQSRTDYGSATLWPGRLEQIFSGVSVVIFSDAIFKVFLRGDDTSAILSGEGDASLRLIYYPVYAVTYLLLIVYHRRLVAVAKACWPLLSIAALSVVSVAWSFDPEVTLRRSLALVSTTAFGIYLVCRFRPAEIVALLAWSFGAAAVLSVAVAVAWPEIGVMRGLHEGAWRGVYAHKNTLGYVMIWATAVFYFHHQSERRHRWRRWLGIALFVALIVLSRSATALIVVTSLPILIFLLRALRSQGTSSAAFSLGFLLLVGLGVVLLAASFGSALDVIGRDYTLSGRVELWGLLWDRVQERFWLGYGYGAFWAATTDTPEMIRQLLGWDVIDPHNGFLDIWLSLGFVGFLLVLVSMCSSFLIGILQLRQRRDDAILYLTLLLILVETNLTETEFLLQNSIPWILYVIAFAGIALARGQSAIAPRRPSTTPYGTLPATQTPRGAPRP
jgi:exopolysaccharide production protein ExoQ